MNTRTLSLATCPACGKAHHLPLVFIETEPGQWQSQCTWTLKLVRATLDENERLQIKDK